MSVLPKGLISREQMKGVKGVETIRNTLLPTTNAPFSPSGNNRVIFNVPAITNSFLTQRSYFTFNLLTNATSTKFYRGSCVPFRSLKVFSPNGMLLEHITDFHLYSKMKDVLFKSKCDLEAEYATTKNPLAVAQSAWDGDQEKFSNGLPVIMSPHSSLLGQEQQFYIPVNQIATSAGFALRIELELLEPEHFVYSTDATAPSYQITEMTYEMELAQLSNELMRDLFGNNKTIAIPYKSVRTHHNQLHGQQSYNVRITDAAQNLENTYSVIRKTQPLKTSVTTTQEHVSDSDPYTFYGGSDTWNTDTIGANAEHLKKYVFKYGTKFFPNSPVEMPFDKTKTLQAAITHLGLRNPFIQTPLYDAAMGNATNEFEARDFVLVNSFKTTGDPVENGISTISSSAPVEIDLEFNTATDNKELLTFVEQTQTLYIKNDGITQMIK